MMRKSKTEASKKSSHPTLHTTHRESIEQSPAHMENNDMHPEKLTYAKFSEMRRSLDDDRMGVGRLLLYIAIVVIIGVALTIGVQAYIRYQNEQANKGNTASQPVSTPVAVSYISVNNSMVDDRFADPAIAAATQFTNKATSVGTALAANATAKEGWESFGFDRYTSVERITLGFNGLVEEPQAALTYSVTDKLLQLTLDKVLAAQSELRPGNELAKLTSTNTVKQVDNVSTAGATKLNIYLNEEVKFNLRYTEGNLILDIRQADYVEGSATSQSATTSAASTTSASTTSATTSAAAGSIYDDPARPAAPHYDNSYSKNPQYVSSSYTGNKLRVWNYTYRDFGDRYEFKFRIKDDGSGVNPMKPNVKAYLNNDSADPALIVEIYNINWEILDKAGDSCFSSVAYGNVKNICGKFDAAKSMVTYTISLYKLADFEVDSIENSTVDAARPGEVIWVKIKDN